MTDGKDDADLLRRRKRLRFRARQRGIKEVDLIFGAFAEAEAMSLSREEVAAFEALLDAPDLDVYSWFTGAVPLPSAYDTPLFARIRAHCNRKDPTWNA